MIVDEIHRMNRNIQDFLLEFLETKEMIVFITTTENPYFVINPAIRSRCTILQLKEISNEEMAAGLSKIITTEKLPIKIEPDILAKMCAFSSGDLRVAINALELLVNLYADQTIDETILKNIYDTAYAKGTGVGDEHYDLLSALQKSIRGSDVNASLYYWARLVQNGDFETLMRRMTVIAYEDIGLANPAIPVRVFQACQAFRQIGMPEGRIILGLAIVEMALSEKSNSAYLATDQALNDVQTGKIYSIPKHLKDTHYQSAAKLGSGIGYLYPHDFENDWVAQTYLPKELKNQNFFTFKPHSAYEKKLMQLYLKFTEQQEGGK
nr:replication-associated recombination protein A [Spiroplasma clarkii]